MSKDFKDLFSGHASQYATFRPTYPRELYSFLFDHVIKFDTAWDAGTGNGQVARDLSKRFTKVFATDISSKQIENATKAKNIFYSVAGEKTSFPENSFDLICIAQAIHWFDREKFYQEVKRVAKPEAIIAIWGYGLLTIDPVIDSYLTNFYVNVVGPYWDKERKLIDEHYQTITFPFHEIKSPAFAFSFQWTLQELQGYLTTWSAVQKFINANNVDPVVQLIDSIQKHWSSERMTISFPLFMRFGKIN